MNKVDKTEWLKHNTIGYYSGFGGIEIKYIFSSDIVVYVAGVWCSKKSVHRVKIYYTISGEPYFKHRGIRIHFNECIRV